MRIGHDRADGTLPLEMDDASLPPFAVAPLVLLAEFGERTGSISIREHRCNSLVGEGDGWQASEFSETYPSYART